MFLCEVGANLLQGAKTFHFSLSPYSCIYPVVPPVMSDAEVPRIAILMAMTIHPKLLVHPSPP